MGYWLRDLGLIICLSLQFIIQFKLLSACLLYTSEPDVLMLDDERSMLLRIRGYVEEARIKEPYTVELFPDVEEFYNCGKNFDILLLDIDMPTMSGIQVAKKLLKQNTIIIYN